MSETFNRFKLFDTEYRKLEILSSQRGSTKAATNLNNNITIIMFIIGDIIVEKSNINPVTPTEFLIKELLVKISPTPSDK